MKGRWLSFLLFGFMFLLVTGTRVFSQTRKLDSLWKLFNDKSRPDTIRLKAIDAISDKYLNNKPDTAIILAEKEKQLAIETNQKKYQGHACNIIAVASLNKGDYSKSLDYQAKALEIYEEIGYKKGIGNSYANFGVVYYNESAFPRALEYYLKALKIREEMADKSGIGACYINIGNVYFSMSDYPKGIEYQEKSLRIWEETGNKQNAASCTMNLGSIFFKQSDLPKALEYLFRSLKIQEELGYKQGMGNCFNNIGVVYAEQKNYNKSLENHLRSLAIRKETGDKRGMGTSYGNIGGIYNSLLNFKSAILYNDSSLQVCKEIGDINQERLSYQNLADSYAKTGKYKEAYENYIKFKQLTDSIFNSDNSKQMGDMKTRFEVEKKEAELKARARSLETVNSQEKKIQYFIICGVGVLFLMVILFSAFLYKRFRITNKQKQIIEIKSKELERLSIVARETENSILILDADGTLDWVNTSFERLNGCGLEEFKKKYGNTIYELSNNPEIRNIIQNSVRTKTPVRYESANTLENGRVVWEASTLTPIFNGEGKLSKLIIIDDDITERKLNEEIIKQKNKDITDSILYAKHLQEAILPPISGITEIFPESFIVFKPKDIVSGDFYWFSETPEVGLLAIADCTGHGVPGAFMSVIGNEMLNSSLHDPSVRSPSSALNLLDKKIKEVFKKGRQQHQTQDGMDISIIVLHHKTNLVQFAGAMRPLVLIRNNEAQEFGGDRISIGGREDALEKQFAEKQLTVQAGDMLYLFTDGFVDQFGGPKGKKFKYKNFLRLLCSIADLPVDEQKRKLEQTLSEWQGPLEQVDDISVAGIKIAAK